MASLTCFELCREIPFMGFGEISEMGWIVKNVFSLIIYKHKYGNKLNVMGKMYNFQDI